MTLQGVWIYNSIKNHAPPDFEWGVATLPSVDPTRWKNVSVAGGDILVTTAGAKHVKEAFEFMRYVKAQGSMKNSVWCKGIFRRCAVRLGGRGRSCLDGCDRH